MNLGELIEGLGVEVASPESASVRVCDVTDDSRTVLPGSLFVARRGTKVDGRGFVQEAVRAGAVAVLTDDPALELPQRPRVALLVAKDVARAAALIAERFYGGPSGRLTLIGVTGTNGKTTTAHLVHQILNGAGVRCGLIGTVVIDDGVCEAPATLTTPPAMELSRTLGVMVDAGCRAAVMEVSSHALHQGRAAALKFDVGVFTNLTGDHLDYHGTMEAYGGAKAELFAMLPPTGTAVANAGDPWTPRMLQGCRAKALRCAVGADGGECVATVGSMTMSGTEAEFVGPWGRFTAQMRLVGPHNVMNALEAVSACFAAGASMADLQRGIEAAVAPPGRLEPVTGPGDPFAVLVDYAHTDDALRKVLAAVRPLVPAGGRLVVVFGCGGDRDRTKRPRMGAAAVELADAVVVTSDNPRTERPGAIIADILEGVPKEQRQKLTVEVERRQAIFHAVAAARPGDVVVIAGKGHETYQILPDGAGGTVTTSFDDREVARAALGRGTAAKPAAAANGGRGAPRAVRHIRA